MTGLSPIFASYEEVDAVQGYPYAAGPMSAGGVPVPGVTQPPRPAGVVPGITQAPAAPMAGFPAGAAPQTAPPGTYPSAPNPFAPPVYQTPGPATLGSAPSAGGAGGVAGVAMAPITGVTPPAGTGGPHPLPGLPQMPLPQGFPNPFQHPQVPLSAAPPPGGLPPLTPGSITTTGPQGYMPGIGSFGAPGGMPGPAPAPQVHLPPMPAAFQAPPQAPQAARPADPHPFWQQLAWQLTHAPQVRAALGDAVAALVEGPDRMKVLQLAASCLTADELQAAFRALSAGTLDQTGFIANFAASFQRTLQAAGLLPS